MGVAKTCISEICEKEHELKAFGMLNGMWGLGKRERERQRGIERERQEKGESERATQRERERGIDKLT